MYETSPTWIIGLSYAAFCLIILTSLHKWIAKFVLSALCYMNECSWYFTHVPGSKVLITWLLNLFCKGCVNVWHNFFGTSGKKWNGLMSVCLVAKINRTVCNFLQWQKFQVHSGFYDWVLNNLMLRKKGFFYSLQKTHRKELFSIIC